jgi:inorganic pyrophosphatase
MLLWQYGRQMNLHGRAGFGRRRTVVLGWACLAILPVLPIAQVPEGGPNELSAAATALLAESLAESRAHATHVWRDTAPRNDDGTVNAYIEISRGDRRKWEFDMGANALAIDRIIPEEVGGYPINYGFVPQTVSYDGDPFDVLVLGPAIPGGRLVRGAIVGLMFMEDDNALDAKVVLSRAGADGRPVDRLTDRDRQDVSDYFRRYKQHESGKVTSVPGWGSIADGLAHLMTTHAFFRECRRPSGAPCRVMP